MRTLLALGLALTLLTGCGSTSSNPPVCPNLVEYTASRQDKAAAEIEAMPPGSETPIFMADYGRLRAQVRACKTAPR